MHSQVLTHSRRLRSKLRLIEPRMWEAASAVWLHERFAELYPEFMFAIHSIIRATAPSMRAAAACARSQAATDPVCAAMAAYLAEHAEEENGHDEWALADLEVLGVSAAEVQQRVPSATVAALVGSQYYWMYHFHPVAYLAYIAVLESPPSIEALEKIVMDSGLPQNAFRTWFYHGQLDPTHVREFDELVDSLPLNDWHHKVMGVNLFQTAELQARIFEEVVQQFDRRQSASVAHAVSLG